MKAVYWRESFNELHALKIEGEQAHHLIKVARVKVGEEVLVLNGKGFVAKSRVTIVSKKDLSLEIIEVTKVDNLGTIDLLIMVPKKEYLEDIFRSSVELGIRRIYPMVSTYSQQSFEVNNRLERIMESALVQSNNPFFPEIKPLLQFHDLDTLLDNYEEIFYFSSQTKEVRGARPHRASALLIIGPEGGLSPEEEQYLFDHDAVQLIHLDGPILRSVTAVPTAFGYISALRSPLKK